MVMAQVSGLRIMLPLLLGLTIASSSCPDLAAPAVNAADCVDARDREHLKTLALKALDDAFELQLAHLYEVWLRDLRGQPQRAQNGVTRAIKAWQEARRNVERYRPLECPK